jgi:hypothetical protein
MRQSTGDKAARFGALTKMSVIKIRAVGDEAMPIECAGTTPRRVGWTRPKPARASGTLSGPPVKGDAMKRFTLMICAVLGIALGCETAQAGWGSLHYGGQQPWWNIFAKRNRGMSVEEERLQRFWHDYYHALKRYYGSLDRIDWVAYYKNHGYQINAGCSAGPCGGAQRIQFAPVFVSPTMQWAVPNGCLSGPPAGAPGAPGMMPYPPMNQGMNYGMPVY